MDFQSIADSFGVMACVLSVEPLPGGGGTVRIVTGNRAYIDSIEHPSAGTELLTKQFVPNSEYTRYLTRDLNFEDYCYRAAVERKCLHSYAHPDRMDVWIDMTFLPLAAEADGLHYCVYTMELDFAPNTQRLSGSVNSELAAAVLATSLKLRNASDFTAAMGDVIRDVRALCDARFCCILLLNPERRRCHVLCEDYADDIPASHTAVLASEDYYEIAGSWADTIAGSNCLVVKNEREMEVVRERSPRWYAILEATDVRTIMLFPLKTQSELLGYIWATNFDPRKAETIKETLELATFVLSSEIANFLLLDQLRFLSGRDLLTGLNNRNAMNERVAAIQKGKEAAGQSVGAVYADLNGLKRVNDTRGHAAGDQLLRDAADAFRAAFPESCVYRIGGDEFAALLPGVTEADVERHIAALAAAAARYPDVDFAVGASVCADGRDIHAALREADERMYADKRAHYARNPKPAGDDRR